MVRTYWQCRNQAGWTETDCEELLPATQTEGDMFHLLQDSWTPKNTSSTGEVHCHTCKVKGIQYAVKPV